MALIVSLISFALCAFFYVRMIRREIPEPMTKKQSVVPVLLGLAAVVLATIFVILLGLAITAVIGVPLSGSISNLVLRSLVGSFLNAGFTEELAKFLLFLLAIKICKPKNVYEYALLCAGIGFGFTALEENVYSGGGAVQSLLRLPCFALHMCFGILMGSHWGLAKYSRQEGTSDAGKHTFLAFFLPVLWHTIFDMVTAKNALLESEDETTALTGFVVAVVVMIASCVLQFVLLSKFKKKTEEYCAMEVAT